MRRRRRGNGTMTHNILKRTPEGRILRHGQLKLSNSSLNLHYALHSELRRGWTMCRPAILVVRQVVPSKTPLLGVRILLNDVHSACACIH